MRRKRCVGCDGQVEDLEESSPFEHPTVAFETCGDCTHLLISTPPGYAWRMKLLSVLERAYGLKASQRKEPPDE